ncbi:MAG: hypothetical protein AAF462_08885 [Thermodesulfobacteriota bacterium]
MNSKFFGSKWLVMLQIVIAASIFMFMPADAFSQKKKDPRCRFRNPDTNRIFKYRCDRFQSKGDIDSITPQLKIISPLPGEEIDYSALAEADLTDLQGNPITVKLLPITIVISPASEYTVDFTAATNAATEYAFEPQVDGVGHAHAYVGPDIDTVNLGDTDGDGVDEYSVGFVGQNNRSDFAGGFCVFREPADQENGYQLLTTNCPLWQFGEDIVEGAPYRVIVDTTENSHGPRIKAHPRDMPSGDKQVITFINVSE